MFQRISLPITTATLLFGLITLAPAQPKTTAPKSQPVTATGIVVRAPRATDFDLRTSARTYRVRFHSKTQMKDVRGGDRVRVYGRPLGLVIYDANVRLLEKKASDNAEDYDEPSVERLDGKPTKGSQEN